MERHGAALASGRAHLSRAPGTAGARRAHSSVRPGPAEESASAVRMTAAGSQSRAGGGSRGGAPLSPPAHAHTARTQRFCWAAGDATHGKCTPATAWRAENGVMLMRPCRAALGPDRANRGGASPPALQHGSASPPREGPGATPRGPHAGRRANIRQGAAASAPHRLFDAHVLREHDHPKGALVQVPDFAVARVRRERVIQVVRGGQALHSSGRGRAARRSHPATRLPPCASASQEHRPFTCTADRTCLA